jgi:hypothetical protein
MPQSCSHLPVMRCQRKPENPSSLEGQSWTQECSFLRKQDHAQSPRSRPHVISTSTIELLGWDYKLLQVNAKVCPIFRQLPRGLDSSLFLLDTQFQLTVSGSQRQSVINLERGSSSLFIHFLLMKQCSRLLQDCVRLTLRGQPFLHSLCSAREREE